MSRDETIEVRLTTAEKEELRAVAERAGLPVSAWLRTVALRAARRLEENMQ